MRARNPGAATCRALYPNPIPTGEAPPPCDVDSSDKYYCVGGAFLKYLNTGDAHRSFPGDGTLAEALRSVNSRLDFFTALDYAKRITYANDDNQMERAWSLLDQALNSN